MGAAVARGASGVTVWVLSHARGLRRRVPRGPVFGASRPAPVAVRDGVADGCLQPRHSAKVRGGRRANARDEPPGRGAVRTKAVGSKRRGDQDAAQHRVDLLSKERDVRRRPGAGRLGGHALRV